MTTTQPAEVLAQLSSFHTASQRLDILAHAEAVVRVESIFCFRCDYAFDYCTCRGWKERVGEVQLRHRRAVRAAKTPMPSEPAARPGRPPQGRLGGPPRVGTR